MTTNRRIELIKGYRQLYKVLKWYLWLFKYLAFDRTYNTRFFFALFTRFYSCISFTVLTTAAGKTLQFELLPHRKLCLITYILTKPNNVRDLEKPSERQKGNTYCAKTHMMSDRANLFKKWEDRWRKETKSFARALSHERADFGNRKK